VGVLRAGVVTRHVTHCYRLSVRTIRDNSTVKTDNAIQQFTQAFNELKARFRERMDVESWKIACTMKDGVIQLVSKTDRLKELGEFSTDIPCHVLLIHNCSRR
jgi:hypothetical protein